LIQIIQAPQLQTLPRHLAFLLSFQALVQDGKVHEIRDIFWDGIPTPGASWLREQPLEQKWQRVVLIPACGGHF